MPQNFPTWSIVYKKFQNSPLGGVSRHRSTWTWHPKDRHAHRMPALLDTDAPTRSSRSRTLERGGDGRQIVSQLLSITEDYCRTLSHHSLIRCLGKFTRWLEAGYKARSDCWTLKAENADLREISTPFLWSPATLDSPLWNLILADLVFLGVWELKTGSECLLAVRLVLGRVSVGWGNAASPEPQPEAPTATRTE